MIRTLYARLALVLLVLVALLGAIFTIGTLLSTRAFFAEINQELHRELAEHLVADSLPMTDGEVDSEALEHIFHMLMVVNPSIEVYLLDPGGEILAFSAPEGAVMRRRVGLAPVHEFLAADGELPIWGDDPRDPERRRVFSAAAIGPPGPIEGYLYVVLGGEQLDSAVAMVRSSQALRLGLGAMATLAVFTVVTGLLLFSRITRRIRRLSDAVEAFRASGFASTALGAPAAPPAARRPARDEIDLLEANFRRMAERMCEQVEELRKTDLLRRELVANVSHDLQTPLTSLQGYLETLRVKPDLSEEERGRYFDVALKQTRRLSGLVSELMELARLDSATIETRLEPLALSELVQDIVQEFRLAGEKRGVEVVADLPSGLALVEADVGLIARALENLVDNGLRHTPAGGRVAVRLRPNGSRVTVVVEDTGSGIAAEDLPRVFDRFFAGRSSDGDAGTGLGLAIARRIVELHGSTITVTSEPGTGSAFSFELARVT